MIADADAVADDAGDKGGGSRELPTLLSQVLIAVVIGADNAFEKRMPHRTTRGPATDGRGPWLTSYAMWANLLRYLPEQGCPREALGRQPELVNMNGLVRWGYLFEADGRVVPTGWGRLANRIWASLVAESDDRWRSRFGDALHSSLAAVAPSIPAPLPRFAPVLARGRTTDALAGWRPPDTDSEGPHGVITQLVGAVMAFALDVEARAALPFQHTSTTLAAVGEEATPLRMIAERSGIAAESSVASVNTLVSAGCLEKADGSGRGMRVRLTRRGEHALQDRRVAVAAVEAEWRARAGDAAVDSLRDALEGVLDAHDALADRMRPPSTGWRAHPPYLAATRRLLDNPRAALPRYPMITHRGGFPDGA